MTTIKKLITFTEEGWGAVVKIKERNNLLKDNDAVRHAIAYCNNKEEPSYVMATKNKVPLTPEEKAQVRVEVQEAKENIKQTKAEKQLEERKENGKRICILLKGKTHTDHNKNTKCFWNSGSYINPKNASIIENEEYVEDLTEEHVQKQFYNSVKGEIVPKEVVVQALKNCGEKWKDN